VIIKAYDETSLQTITEQIASIKSLAGKGVKDIQILGPDAPRPGGCVAYPISTSAAVFLYVKGRVNMDSEIAKAQKKLDKVKANIQKQEKILLDPSYKEKVSEAVQVSDQAKLAESRQEAKSFEETIKQFEQIKLE
jgi:valyl-tRNA synthetase